MSSILIIINIYIRLTRFLENGIADIIYDINKKIQKNYLIYFKKISAKLIFSKCTSLN